MIRNRVLQLLLISKYVLTKEEICFVVGCGADELTRVLHGLQDTDHVIMKNGFYRPSEKSKKEYNET